MHKPFVNLIELKCGFLPLMRAKMPGGLLMKYRSTVALNAFNSFASLWRNAPKLQCDFAVVVANIL
jgi:hypothetical protein